MMINLTTVISIAGGIILVGGAIVGFFQMQTRQNMKIDALEKEVEDLKRKLSTQTQYQIATEKELGVINTKLDNIMCAINDLKERRKDDLRS